MSQKPRVNLDAVSRAKADVARVVSRSMRVLRHGLGQRSKEDIQAEFDKPQGEAALWAHAAVRLSAEHVKVQGKNPSADPKSQLAVVVVSPAGSVEAWQQQAEAFQIATTPRKVIEAAESKSPVTSSKDS